MVLGLLLDGTLSELVPWYQSGGTMMCGYRKNRKSSLNKEFMPYISALILAVRMWKKTWKIDIGLLKIRI